jgi:undecaprenyl phosphate N,N'-diacetylbacillosamine 1-phosphate transferase
MPWKEKFNLDAYYVDHLSFFLDLKILLKTIILIFSFRKDVSLEEEKFTGN